MEREKKVLVQVFIILFVAFLILFNWGRISWLFNRKVLSQFVSDFFSAHKIPPPQIGTMLSQGQRVNPQKKKGKEENCLFSPKEDSIEIPKFNIKAPLVFPSNSENLHKALDRGVVHYPSSSLPGEKGRVVFLGHSAPPGWPHIKYDWVFTRLGELNKGDEIIIYFHHCRHNYFVEKKTIIPRGSELPKASTAPDNNLFLLTCWPPGKDYRRLAVEALPQEGEPVVE